MFLFFLGIASLLIGAKALVAGAEQLARQLGLSTLTIGLTVVAYGTSAPELFTCMLAAHRGQADIVMGNILGSNIFNILFILGLAALFRPLQVERKVVRLDVPIMIFVSILFWLLAQNGVLDKVEGGLLFLGILVYSIFLISKTRSSEREPPTWSIFSQLVAISGGIFLLSFGSNWLLTGATQLAIFFNINSLLVGLTCVAIGTSLPELATTLVSLLKKQPDLAVGNIIGSNIFNLLAVGGLSALTSSHGVVISPAALHFDIPIMVAAAVAAFPIVLTGHKIDRWEGILLLLYYLFYLALLFVKTPLDLFWMAFLFFLLPMTILVFIIALIRHAKKT